MLRWYLGGGRGCGVTRVSSPSYPLGSPGAMGTLSRCPLGRELALPGGQTGSGQQWGLVASHSITFHLQPPVLFVSSKELSYGLWREIISRITISTSEVKGWFVPCGSASREASFTAGDQLQDLEQGTRDLSGGNRMKSVLSLLPSS